MMKQHHGRAEYDKYEKNYSFLVEREKLLNNLESARRASEEVFVLIDQLRRLVEELELTKGDLRSLKRELNRTALEFGLQPIQSRQKKS